MNGRAAQLRIGATNFVFLISRSARKASDSSLVVFEMIFVAVTLPLTSTVASTVTTPWIVARSENEGSGALAKLKSVSAGQPRRDFACVVTSRRTSGADTNPVVP